LFKVWILATAGSELLAYQPYGSASTHIKDFRLVKGPNIVLDLSTQFKLLPGMKVYVDNLFMPMDLLDHMKDQQWGVTGTLCQNQIIGIPLPGKKEDMRNMKKGETEVVYSNDNTVIVWKDNLPVYLASNCETLHPMGQRYSSKDKRYLHALLPAPHEPPLQQAVLWSWSRKEPELLARARAGILKFWLRLQLQVKLN
jgi:hypothetical protein